MNAFVYWHSQLVYPLSFLWLCEFTSFTLVWEPRFFPLACESTFLIRESSLFPCEFSLFAMTFLSFAFFPFCKTSSENRTQANGYNMKLPCASLKLWRLQSGLGVGRKKNSKLDTMVSMHTLKWSSGIDTKCTFWPSLLVVPDHRQPQSTHHQPHLIQEVKDRKESPPLTSCGYKILVVATQVVVAAKAVVAAKVGGGCEVNMVTEGGCGG